MPVVMENTGHFLFSAMNSQVRGGGNVLEVTETFAGEDLIPHRLSSHRDASKGTVEESEWRAAGFCAAFCFSFPQNLRALSTAALFFVLLNDSELRFLRRFRVGKLTYVQSEGL